MTVTRRDEIEEIIIQALGHPERRNIIEILGTSKENVSYSEILGEIGLNTGKMNYHLKLLEGVIERDKNRRYSLTPIGKKAFVILNSMTTDLENGYEDYLGKVKLSHNSGILRLANIWYAVIALLSLSAVAGLWVFVDTAIRVGEFSSSSMLIVYGLLAITILGLFFLRGWVRKQAESVQDFVDKIMGKLTKR
ncbi:MAG: winged helix-turn-helix domain-containing protein [Promethearchaeota archaeon]